MNDIAIRVENVSKQYKIGSAEAEYETLRDHITDTFKGLFQRNGRPHMNKDTIWALKDVSFEVKEGEVLGIIGRNGAGKSTLLKILSRITEPTQGIAKIYGRMASLLEVGTGFHPELTGRENVYLNGAVLGMARAEIKRKFDEIVAFSGVEKFIDTPVKRYSSGMKVRLAFSVAAHLEPDILIIDEVLAVGDVSFQNKCLGKMGQVAHGGRTVLFVSHNMAAIANLCTTAMWLDQGKMVQSGDVRSTSNSYIKTAMQFEQQSDKFWNRTGTGEAQITKASLLDSMGNDCTTFSMGDSLIIEFEMVFHRPFKCVNLSVEIKRTEMGMNVLHLESQDCGLVIEEIPRGSRRFRVEIPDCLLYPTQYQISLCIWSEGNTFDHVNDILAFSVEQGAISKRSTRLSIHKEAIFYVRSQWKELPAP